MNKKKATLKQIAEAKRLYQDVDIEIDANALVSQDENDSSGLWVQAWVWIEK